MRKTFFHIAVCTLALSGFLSCRKALDPLANGYYTDENLDQYPSLFKGFVDEAYVLANVQTYKTSEYIYLDCATDNAVATSPTLAMRKLANGSLSPSDDPVLTYWTRDYQAIYYCNRFLKDRKGISLQYMRDNAQDILLRRNYQGDAFALRAWFEYDLLMKFGGRGTDGALYGFPISVDIVDPSTADPAQIKRDTYDDCVQRILDDCDSALVYLPLANRDWLAENTAVQGSCRWSRFDQMSVVALKAMTCLLWASDAFNPAGDVTRWEKAAGFAAQAMKMKMEQDGTHGFVPLASFSWGDPNTAEAYWIARPSSKTNTMEISQYPNGFGGSCAYAPTQELVDAFPAANGYPITDSRSGYDPKHPYLNRDPRFYATVFYNGAEAKRVGTGEVMYTFDTVNGGRDSNGLPGNSLTNYYLKKFVYMGWNKSDQSVQTMPRAVIYIGWRDMCLTLAEAANRAYGPNDNRLGWSAAEALEFIRSRMTSDGELGLGYNGDPYLEECAADSRKFETLVRNERRLEFCFEGRRFADLVRWGVPLEQRNNAVHRVKIITSGANSVYSTVTVDERALPSVFLPIPYSEMINSPSLVQNEGWTTWTR